MVVVVVEGKGRKGCVAERSKRKKSASSGRSASTGLESDLGRGSRTDWGGQVSGSRTGIGRPGECDHSVAVLECSRSHPSWAAPRAAR